MLKNACIGCGQIGEKITKEHLFPRWLIKKTGTDKTGIKWRNRKRIPASAATIPLCKKCNEEFGTELEGTIARIFDDLESNKGISDQEAELLIRWLWKFEGLFWLINSPNKIYTRNYTLKERILRPIDSIRSELILAISLIKGIDPQYGDAPMGIDSYNVKNAIFVAGVFSKVALMVLLRDFSDLVPKNYSLYLLSSKKNQLSNTKLFYPKIGFENDTEAVVVSVIASKKLSLLHDGIFQQ